MTKAIDNSMMAGRANNSILDNLAQHAHWAPRIALASVFLYHGLTKFPALSGMAEMMGLPVAILALVALAETAGGALIVLGAFTKDIVTRIGGLLLLPPMLGAIGMVHWGRWAFTPADGYPMGGMEFQVTLVLVAIFFILRGNKA